MKKIRKVLLVAAGLLFLLVTVPFGYVQLRDRDQSSNSGLSFPALPLVLTAEASTLAQAGAAFPADQAGMAAYIKMPSININNVIPIFDQLEELGANYAIGRITLGDGACPSPVRVARIYVDTDGWVVVFKNKNLPVSHNLRWVRVEDIATVPPLDLEEPIQHAQILDIVCTDYGQPHLRRQSTAFKTLPHYSN